MAMNAANRIVIVGGGVIGLSIAVELKLRDRTTQVIVLSRDFARSASHAAAGMLAPLAEEIASPQMLDLCLQSRWLYPKWTQKLEELTGIDPGYRPCGILAPVSRIPQTIVKPNVTAQWLDRDVLPYYQTGLGRDIVGAWWYPEDAQADNRQLVKALHQAAIDLGCEIREGAEVGSIEQKHGKIGRIRTNNEDLEADICILAAGSWSGQLIPVPVCPVKGQMMAVTMPSPSPLQRVIFGEGIYLVPRHNGRLIIGATVERVGWQPKNTPKGLNELLVGATRLFPELENWEVEDIWWGFRPATPDELPILGTSPCDNLILATGHYRNGILLAPITAALIADLILTGKSDPLLEHFNWQRFSQKSEIRKISANNTIEKQHSTKNMQIAPSIPSIISNPAVEDDRLVIGGRNFNSRLMTGTGKYPNMEAMQQSIIASGCEIVTVAVRRVQTKAAGHEGLAEAIDWGKIWMLPNTAGCQTAEEAIRVARLGREMAKLLGQEDNNFIKLEVIPDAKYLLPDPIGTLQAAEQLVKEGFAVLPYINADPLLAKRLEEVGCATVMPLGSPIGSGQGIKNTANIAIIIEEATIPVVVDAGIGTPSEAAAAMEMGADAVLINSAIALASDPVIMARAMGMATQAGRLAYAAGRIPIKQYATASSPLTGTIVG
jgi:thiazole synthase